MRFYKAIKQLSISLFLFLFATFMLGLTPYSLASTASLGIETLTSQSDTQMLPAPLHYFWLQSATGFLPIEEVLGAFLSKSLQPGLQYIPGSPNNELNVSETYIRTYSLPFFGLLYCFIRGRNSSLANAIPLGGHAPPAFAFSKNVLTLY